MDIPAYLARIHYTGLLEPSAAMLGDLQLCHLYHVPFENLDIGLGRPIRLDLEALYEKIVMRRRGGFCYELNGLFAALLERLGYRVTYLSARDAHEDGSLGPEFDHLTLLVQIPRGGSARWLVDVGWGDTFRRPLRLDEPGEQSDGRLIYRIETLEGGDRLLWQRWQDGIYERQYRFSLLPRRFPQDYAAMCLYHQTSPQSHFTQKRICTRATPGGRVTFSDGRLILTEEGVRSEQTVLEGEDEGLLPGPYRRVLAEHFDIYL